MLGTPQTTKETAMPGGRLTQQERQQIALGLADSLAYAEIARRLDRPTSTITREVMRNGGPTGYRADLAHPATATRAHRRRPAPPRPRPPPPPARARHRPRGPAGHHRLRARPRGRGRIRGDPHHRP